MLNLIVSNSVQLLCQGITLNKVRVGIGYKLWKFIERLVSVAKMIFILYITIQLQVFFSDEKFEDLLWQLLDMQDLVVSFLQWSALYPSYPRLPIFLLFVF